MLGTGTNHVPWCASRDGVSVYITVCVRKVSELLESRIKHVVRFSGVWLQSTGFCKNPGKKKTGRGIQELLKQTYYPRNPGACF